MWRGTLNVDLWGLHRGVQPADDLYLLKKCSPQRPGCSPNRPGYGSQAPWRVGDLWDPRPGGTGTTIVQCPFCDGQVKETIYHLVFECLAWSTCRTLELEETFKEVVLLLEKPPKIADLQKRRKGRLSWVLGGTYDQRYLSNWSPIGVNAGYVLYKHWHKPSG